jgi:hypothetical protein
MTFITDKLGTEEDDEDEGEGEGEGEVETIKAEAAVDTVVGESED